MAKQYSVTVNGTVYDVTVEEIGTAAVVSAPAAPVQVQAPTPAPVLAAAPAPTPAPAPAAPAASVASGSGDPINAPLNGNILKVNVQTGVSVKSGDVLCILEAMKMENEIVAPKDGKITSVAVQTGATVNSGDLLFTLA